MATRDLTLRTRIEDKLTPALKMQAKRMNDLRNEVDDVTDQLKIFGERGEKIANTLEEIQDPLRRIQLGQRLYRQELKRSKSPLGKFETGLKSAKAEMVATGGAIGGPQGVLTAILAVEGALLAAGIAAGKVAADAWVAFAKENKDAKKALDKFNDSMGRFHRGIGEVVDETVGATDIIRGLAEEIDSLSGAVRDFTDDDSMHKFELWLTNVANSPVPVVNLFADGLLRVTRHMRGVGEDAQAADEKLDQFVKDMSGGYNATMLESFERTMMVREEVVKLQQTFDNFSTETAMGALRDLMNTGFFAMADPSKLPGNKRRGGGGRRRKRQAPLSGQTIFEGGGTTGASFGGFAGGQSQFFGIGAGVALQQEQAIRIVNAQAQIEKEKLKATLAEIVEIWEPIRAQTSKLDDEAQRRIDSDPQILALRAQKREAELVKEGYEELFTLLEGEGRAAVLGIATDLAYMSGQLIAGAKNSNEFGMVFVDSLKNLVKAVAPAFIQLGVAMVGTESGNPAALIGAGIALSAIAGALSQFKSSKRSVSVTDNTSRLRQIADEFQGNRPDREERMFQLFISREGAEGIIGNVVRDSAQRGRFGAVPRAGFMP